MKFSKMFHKKAKSAPKASKQRKGSRVPLATDDLTRKERKILGKKMRQVNREVPILNYLKPKPISLSYLADHLADYAKNQDGAVRVLTDNDGHEAYSVLIVTEDMLEDLGFSVNKKQNPEGLRDLGQLAAQISSNQIATATTVKDYEDHRLVIIPINDTLDALEEYDEFKKADFKWAAFPVSGMDDVRQAEVFQLANTVTLAELHQIAVNHSELSMNDQNEVAIVNDDEGPDTSVDDSNEDSAVPSVDDGGAFDPTDQLNMPGMDDFSNTDDNDSSVTSNPNQPAQVERPASELNSQPAMTSTDAMLNNAANDNSGGDNNDDVNADLQDLMSRSGLTSSADNSNGSSVPVDLNAIPDDDSDNQGNNSLTGVNTVPAAQSKDEYDANLAEATSSIKTYKDYLDNNDLNLVIDTTQFDNQSQNHKPIQFTIENVDPNDKLGQLANQYRQQYNDRLRSDYEAQESALRNLFISRASNTANYIMQRLNHLKGNSSKLAQKGEQIEQDHKVNEQAIESNWAQYVAEQTAAYEEKKKQAGEKAKADALAEYDAENSEAFQTKLDVEHQKRLSAENSRYLSHKHELQNQKIRIAQTAYLSTINGIMKDINKARQDNYEKNKALFEKFNRSIQDLMNNQYTSERDRQIAAAKALAHDHAVEDAEAHAKQVEKEFQQKRDQIQQDADNKVARLSKSYEDSAKQTRESYESQIASLKSQLDQASQNVTLAQQKAIRDVQQAKEENKSEIDRLMAEHSRNTKLSDQQYDRSRKNALLISILSIVAALLVGFVIRGFFGGNQSNNNTANNEPRQEQTTKSDNTKKQPATTVTNNYNYGGTAAENSSKNGNSSKANSSETADSNSTTTAKSNGTASAANNN